MGTKHPGFKEASDKADNGLFAELHPSWSKESGLEAALKKALKGGNPQYGVMGSPSSTSVGE